MSISQLSVSTKKKLKIVFLGNQNVGKTSIINRFINDRFDQSETSTIGIDFLVRNFQYQNKSYRLQLWDTAGQQRFKSLIPSYLKDSNCAVIVYDVANKESFESVFQWIDLYCQHKDQTSFAIVVGNKVDLEKRFQDFSEQSIQTKCAVQGIQHMFVSAKSSQNLKEMFEKLIKILHTNREKQINNLTGEILDQSQKIDRKESQKNNISPQIKNPIQYNPNITEGPILKENGEESIKGFMTPRQRKNQHTKAVKLDEKNKETEQQQKLKKRCC